MTNIEQTHANLVANLSKPGFEIRTQMTDAQAHLLHMAIGVSGEAGELLDAIKKHVIYQDDLDMDNVIEELGDLEFYLAGIRETFGIDRDHCLAMNVNKLSRRYPDGEYSNADAIQRADKA